MNNTTTMQLTSSLEAVSEYHKWRDLLTEKQRQKLLSATLSQDGCEWCVMSGSDLMFDRAGFGKSIPEAIRDYVSVYITMNRAS